MKGRPLWPLAYVFLSVVWGLAFYFIMVGLESLTPAQVALSRLFFGAATLWVLVVIHQIALPQDRQAWGHLFVLGFLLNSAPGFLFAYAEQYISTILAGIINGSTPLFGLLAMLVIFREQSPTQAQKIGLLVGFVGVLTVLGVWQGFGSGSWPGIVAATLAVSFYGLSFPYAKRYLTPRGISPISGAAIQVSAGLLQIAPVVALQGVALAPTSRSLLAMVVLGVFASGFAFALNQWLIHLKGPVLASTVAYWTPLVAVMAGVLLLSEKLHWYEPVGGVILLLGVVIAQGRLPLWRR
jgi:drug/metabolite transporter (DMT)-like permease